MSQLGQEGDCGPAGQILSMGRTGHLGPQNESWPAGNLSPADTHVEATSSQLTRNRGIKALIRLQTEALNILRPIQHQFDEFPLDQCMLHPRLTRRSVTTRYSLCT